jgi:hypothetical protein
VAEENTAEKIARLEQDIEVLKRENERLRRLLEEAGSNQSHSSDTVGRKHPVASGTTGSWKQKIPPLIETNSVRTYAGKTGQFTAIQGSSCRNFSTHEISLKLGISSKVKQILTLSHLGGKRSTYRTLTHPTSRFLLNFSSPRNGETIGERR